MSDKATTNHDSIKVTLSLVRNAKVIACQVVLNKVAASLYELAKLLIHYGGVSTLPPSGLGFITMTPSYELLT